MSCVAGVLTLGRNGIVGLIGTGATAIMCRSSRASNVRERTFDFGRFFRFFERSRPRRERFMADFLAHRIRAKKGRVGLSFALSYAEKPDCYVRRQTVGEKWEGIRGKAVKKSLSASAYIKPQALLRPGR